LCFRCLADFRARHSEYQAAKNETFLKSKQKLNQVQLQAKCYAYFKQKDLQPMIPMMNFKSNYATQIHVQTERKLTSNKADQMHFNLKNTAKLDPNSAQFSSSTIQIKHKRTKSKAQPTT
jgi:hypothetical protein